MDDEAEDIYEDYRELVENDEISAEEEGFVRGYNKAYKKSGED